MNSDLKTGDRSDNSSINNIVGGNILPFTLPTRFGAPTQRDSDMHTRGTTDDFTRTPNLTGRNGVFSKTDRNFNKTAQNGFK